MPRGGVRETERDRICSSNTLTTDAVEGGPTPCWCGGESPLYVASCACFVTTGWIRRKSCTRYERVEVRACAACCVCPLTSYVYHLPTGQAQVLRACVRPNHSNSSTGLQHQQQQYNSFASVVPNPCAAAGKPYTLGVGRTCNALQTFTHQQQRYSHTNLYGNVIKW